jgi:hypothetical protein
MKPKNLACAQRAQIHGTTLGTHDSERLTPLASAGSAGRQRNSAVSHRLVNELSQLRHELVFLLCHSLKLGNLRL